MIKKSVLIIFCILFIVGCVTDNDKDGFLPPADCDDLNPDINPGTVEIPEDGFDNNCDGIIDSGPSADIWSDPNPCIIQPGETQCTSTVFWKSNNINKPYVQINMVDSNSSVFMWKCRPSNRDDPYNEDPQLRTSKEVTWIVEEGNTFKMFPVDDCKIENPMENVIAEHYVKGEKVQPSAVILSHPNPCTIEYGEAECTSRIYWRSENIEKDYIQINMIDSNGSVFMWKCRPSNLNNLYHSENQLRTSKDVNWIKEEGNTFKMFPVDDCIGDNPMNEDDVLAEHFVKGEKIKAKIWADPGPCLINPGETYCTSNITWSSSTEIEEGNVLVLKPNGERFKCGKAGNLPPSNPNKLATRTHWPYEWISEEEQEFTIYATEDCITPKGPALDSVKVKGVKRPVCSVTGEPMRNVPKDFVSLDIYTLNPGNHIHRYIDAINYLGDLNLGKVKSTIQWFNLEKEPGVWDWSRYDGIVNDLASRGVPIELELHGVPLWESYCDDSMVVEYCDKIDWGGCSKRDGNKVAGNVYAPKNIEAWKEYVRKVVDRYKDKVDSWGVWAEPTNKKMLMTHPDDYCNPEVRSDQYIRVLRAAYDVIKEVDDVDADGDGESAVVLASNMNINNEWFDEYETDPEEWRIKQFFVKVLDQAGDKFDAWSVHCFADDNMEDLIETVNDARVLLDEYGFEDTPLLVTSVQLNTERGWVKMNINCPFVDIKPEIELPDPLSPPDICLSDPDDIVCQPESYNGYTDEEIGAELVNMYACLANAGADGVSWFEMGQINANYWATPWDFSADWCPPDGIHKMGVLSQYKDEEENRRHGTVKAYYDLMDVSDYVELINSE
ncbi:MopE-related protein [Nanoarchaeota archaeon]